MVSVLFAGGGTTGHISPLLAIAAELRRREPDSQITVLGTPEGLETRLVPQAGFELVTIPKVPAPRRLNADAFTFPGRLASTITRVRRLIRDRGIDVVVGVGGYVSTPAYLAARSLSRPIIIHEANAVPGLANRLGAKLAPAANIGYTFAGTPLPGTQVGMPMRAEIVALSGQRSAHQAAARARLGLAADLPTLIVTGGSSGAQAINEAFAAAQTEIHAAGIQVLHITGAGKAQELRTASADNPRYHVVEYVDGMEDVYAAADLLVCRSGAGTVAEVSVAEVPAVYVPLAIGNGEQRKNAAAAVAAQGALLVPNADFSAATVIDTVLPLVTDRERLAAMSARLRELSFPHRAGELMTDKLLTAVRSAAPHAKD